MVNTQSSEAVIITHPFVFMARRRRAWWNLFLVTQGEYEKKTNISWRYTMCQAWKRCFLERMSYTLRTYLGHWGYFWFWTPAHLLTWSTVWQEPCGIGGCVNTVIGGPVISRGVTINLQVASWSPFLLCQCPLPPVLTAKTTCPVTAADSHSSLFLPSLPSTRFSFFVSSPVTSSPFLGFWMKKLVNVILCFFITNWSLGSRFKSLGVGLSPLRSVAWPLVGIQQELGDRSCGM